MREFLKDILQCVNASPREQIRYNSGFARPLLVFLSERGADLKLDLSEGWPQFLAVPEAQSVAPNLSSFKVSAQFGRLLQGRRELNRFIAASKQLEELDIRLSDFSWWKEDTFPPLRKLGLEILSLHEIPYREKIGQRVWDFSKL